MCQSTDFRGEDTVDPGYCIRCDRLVGLDGYHVTGVGEGDDGRLVVQIESQRSAPACPTCGVIMVSHGRRDHRLVDCPCFGRPVELVWRKHTWRCPELVCPGAVLMY